MKYKKLIKLSLLSMYVTTSFNLPKDNNNLNDEKEQITRKVNYDTSLILEDEYLKQFEDNNFIETDNGFEFTASKSLLIDDYEQVNLVSINNEERENIDYKIEYDSHDYMIYLTIKSKDEILVDSLAGFVTTNFLNENDIMFVCENDKIYWLSDVIKEDKINNTGFFSWLKDVFSQALSTTNNKFVSLLTTAIAVGSRLLCHVAVKIVGLNNGAKLLSMYKDSYGNYHADFNGWQQYFGYNNLYDIGFKLGSSMDFRKFSFYDENNDGKEDYILWGWKGDYYELGAGGELGIYRRVQNSDDLWYVDKNYSIYMEMSVKRYSSTIIDWKPLEYYKNTNNDNKYQWWITGFNPNYHYTSKHDLKITYRIKFYTKGCSSYVDNKLKEEFFKKYVVHVTSDTKRWQYDGDYFKYSF